MRFAIYLGTTLFLLLTFVSPGAAEPGTNKLYLGPLPSGEQLQVNWNIISITPLLGVERPLLILCNGTKGSGQSIEFHLISMEVNK